VYDMKKLADANTETQTRDALAALSEVPFVWESHAAATSCGVKLLDGAQAIATSRLRTLRSAPHGRSGKETKALQAYYERVQADLPSDDEGNGASPAIAEGEDGLSASEQSTDASDDDAVVSQSQPASDSAAAPVPDTPTAVSASHASNSAKGEKARTSKAPKKKGIHTTSKPAGITAATIGNDEIGGDADMDDSCPMPGGRGIPAAARVGSVEAKDGKSKPKTKYRPKPKKKQKKKKRDDEYVPVSLTQALFCPR
jgi:hypothetical protein